MRKFPISLLIKPASGNCNLRCKYCFYADVTDNREQKSLGFMSLNTLGTLVEKAFECADEFAAFSFQGGEPTLAGLDFFREFVGFIKKYNKNNIKTQLAIQTNGLLIDENWAKFFAENKFLVGLSLDGTKEIHDEMRVDSAGKGTFNRVNQTADILDSFKVEYNILCVVTNFNARYPRRIYNSLKKFRYLQFIPCLDTFSGEKQKFSLEPGRYGDFLVETFNLYYEDVMNGNFVCIRNFDNYISMLAGGRPESCGMSGICGCYFVAEGDGSIYPCDFYVMDGYKIGNINENSFTEMLSGETAVDFIEKSKHVSPGCRECKWFGICRGGCRRYREPFAGGLPELNKLCGSYEKFFGSCYAKMTEMARVVMRNQ